MDIQKDFKELLELFNAHKVEYMLVGAYALAFHGNPRNTGDIDIFVKPDKENALKILAALNNFGFGALNLEIEDFSSPDKVVQLGVPPVRIDLITSISGVSWEDALNNSVEGLYGEVKVPFIGKKEFITNKKSIGRHKDLADIESLGENTK